MWFFIFLSLFTIKAYGQSPDKDFEVQSIVHQVMIPCRDQYPNHQQNMIDCLIVRSNNKLNLSATHKDFSLYENLTPKPQTKFGLYPKTSQNIIKPKTPRPLLKNSQLQIQLHANDSGFTGRIEFDAVIPISKKSQDKALFIQPGFILSLRNQKGQNNHQTEDNFFIGSVGAVYRFVYQDGLLGFNLFYDRKWGLKNQADHERGSLGADYQSGQHQFSFNYYHPLTDWMDIYDFYEERAVASTDLSWTYLFNNRLEGLMGLTLSDYKTKKDQVDLTLGMSYKLDCDKSLALELERNLSTNNTKVALKYKIIGLSEGYKGSDCLYLPYDTHGLLYQPVKRNKNFKLEKRQKTVKPTVNPSNPGLDLHEDQSRFAPSLKAPDQIVRQGQSLSFSPVISNIELEDFFVVNVNPTLSSGWPLITYSQKDNRFTIDAREADLGEYQIAGHIQNQKGYFSYWFFKVRVVDQDDRQNEDTQDREQDPEDEEGRQDREQNPEDEGSTQDREGTGADRTAPILSTQKQSLREGSTLTYKPHISQLNSGELFTVRITTRANPQSPSLSWDSTTNSFLIDASASTVRLRDHSYIGTIEDQAGNQNSWSLIVSVTQAPVTLSPLPPPESRVQAPVILNPDRSQDSPSDTEAPTLTASTQTLGVGQSFSFSPTIGNLKTNEAYTVAIDSLEAQSPVVTWDQTTKQFTIDASSASLGQYRVSGTIRDSNNNSSHWTFKVTVKAYFVLNREERDNQAPSLTAGNQTVEIGQSLSFNPTIGNLRTNEAYTVTINTLANQAPAVTWSGSTKKFSIDASSAQLGVYTVTGTIRDGNHNSNTWSFRVTVKDTRGPSLVAPNFAMRPGESFSFSPTLWDLRSGESFTVSIEASFTHGPTVTWNQATKKFTVTASQTAAIRTHLVSGTIKDGSNNSNNWSFRVIIRRPQ